MQIPPLVRDCLAVLAEQGGRARWRIRDLVKLALTDTAASAATRLQAPLPSAFFVDRRLLQMSDTSPELTHGDTRSALTSLPTHRTSQRHF